MKFYASRGVLVFDNGRSVQLGPVSRVVLEAVAWPNRVMSVDAVMEYASVTKGCAYVLLGGLRRLGVPMESRKGHGYRVRCEVWIG